MIKFLGVAVAGFLVGVAGMALAHDMAKMNMSAMDMSGRASPATQTASLPPNTIEINNFAFGPGVLNVAAGTTVTWTNHDDEPHTVVNDGNPRLFKSTALDTDDKFTFTFDKPGTYKYFCSIHPQMTGTVVVK